MIALFLVSLAVNLVLAGFLFIEFKNNGKQMDLMKEYETTLKKQNTEVAQIKDSFDKYKSLTSEMTEKFSLLVEEKKVYEDVISMASESINQLMEENDSLRKETENLKKTIENNKRLCLN